MATPAKTWWGQRFIEALEGFTDPARLRRGRGYSTDSRILDFAITAGTVEARVRGNVNRYYGVYEEPRYQIRIRMRPIPAKGWSEAVARIGGNAALVAKLLMNEMPDRIDAAFAGAGLRLLPGSREDFALTQCSCPDYANPCKHIAGVYYRLAERLDRDPFLLFELRGRERGRLRDALAATPLGRALGDLMAADDGPIPMAEAFFTRPGPAARTPDYRSFWHGRGRLPSGIEPSVPAVVAAIPVKKGGDNPAFWDRPGSFIEVMEELCRRARDANKDAL